MVALMELGAAENDEEIVADAEASLSNLVCIAEKRQLESLLSGEADANHCFIEVHAGAGGTEAQDWALMLMRMYSRWSEARGFKIQLIEESAGEEAGIKSVTMRVEGENAYGWMKTDQAFTGWFAFLHMIVQPAATQVLLACGSTRLLTIISR